MHLQSNTNIRFLNILFLILSFIGSSSIQGENCNFLWDVIPNPFMPVIFTLHALQLSTRNAPVSFKNALAIHRNENKIKTAATIAGARVGSYLLEQLLNECSFSQIQITKERKEKLNLNDELPKEKYSLLFWPTEVIMTETVPYQAQALDKLLSYCVRKNITPIQRFMVPSGKIHDAYRTRLLGSLQAACLFKALGYKEHYNKVIPELANHASWLALRTLCNDNNNRLKEALIILTSRVISNYVYHSYNKELSWLTYQEPSKLRRVWESWSYGLVEALCRLTLSEQAKIVDSLFLSQDENESINLKNYVENPDNAESLKLISQIEANVALTLLNIFVSLLFSENQNG